MIISAYSYSIIQLCRSYKFGVGIYIYVLVKFLTNTLVLLFEISKKGFNFNHLEDSRVGQRIIILKLVGVILEQLVRFRSKSICCDRIELPSANNILFSITWS